jgi:LAO/AO transport system kinase
MDAAGFDYVLIETVGAGQSEVEIASTAYTTIVVDAPGLGDDVQAIKAGILEIADILVVNKADRPGVENTVRALRAMLDLGHRLRTVTHHGQRLIQDDGAAPPDYDFWNVPILKTVAMENDGLEAVADAIEQHRAHLRETGMIADRDRQRMESELLERLRDTLLERLLQDRSPAVVEDVIRRMVQRELDPGSAVRELLNGA